MKLWENKKILEKQIQLKKAKKAGLKELRDTLPRYNFDFFRVAAMVIVKHPKLFERYWFNLCGLQKWLQISLLPTQLKCCRTDRLFNAIQTQCEEIEPNLSRVVLRMR